MHVGKPSKAVLVHPSGRDAGRSFRVLFVLLFGSPVTLAASGCDDREVSVCCRTTAVQICRLKKPSSFQRIYPGNTPALLRSCAAVWHFIFRRALLQCWLNSDLSCEKISPYIHTSVKLRAERLRRFGLADCDCIVSRESAAKSDTLRDWREVFFFLISCS